MTDDFPIFDGVRHHKREINRPIAGHNVAKYAFMFANQAAT